MKSNKQRKLEIKAKRLKRAEAKKAKTNVSAFYMFLDHVEANQQELKHNNTYSPLPLFYIDKPFKCIDCGSNELWKASSQKWWYEVAKGHIDSTAVRCRACRIKQRDRKEQQKIHMAMMANKTPHPNEVFFRKQY